MVVSSFTKWLWVRVPLLSRQLVSFDRSNNIGSIDVKMDGLVLLEKSSFKMLELTLYSELDRSTDIISVAKTGSKKIEAFIL